MSELRWYDTPNDKPFTTENLRELVKAVEMNVLHPPYYIFVRGKNELEAAFYWYGDCSDIYIVDSKNNMYCQRKKVGKLNESNQQNAKCS